MQDTPPARHREWRPCRYAAKRGARRNRACLGGGGRCNLARCNMDRRRCLRACPLRARTARIFDRQRKRTRMMKQALMKHAVTNAFASALALALAAAIGVATAGAQS